MDIVKQYLTKRYLETHWRYHGVNKLFYALKDEVQKEELRNEIKELRNLGFIDIVAGCNSWLVKIIEENEFLNLKI